MSPSRPVLNLIDDPVARQAPEQTADAVPTPTTCRVPTRRTPAPTPEPATAAAAAERPAEAPEAPELAQKPGRYRDESKKGVFGRVPRSLSRRLERALVELRDQTDDLTQEQLLAALLARYVNPSDPASLAELAATVDQYRTRL